MCFSTGIVPFALVLGVLLTLQLNQPASNSASGVVNYVAVMKNSDDQPSMVVTLVQEGRQLSLDMLPGGTQVAPQIQTLFQGFNQRTVI